jgi:hypothetical protein
MLLAGVVLGLLPNVSVAKTVSATVPAPLRSSVRAIAVYQNQKSIALKSANPGVQEKYLNLANQILPSLTSMGNEWVAQSAQALTTKALSGDEIRRDAGTKSSQLIVSVEGDQELDIAALWFLVLKQANETLMTATPEFISSVGSDSFQQQYLELQQQMEHASRSYEAISNIMKTKHDTVKNSISNVR